MEGLVRMIMGMGVRMSLLGMGMAKGIGIGRMGMRLGAVARKRLGDRGGVYGRGGRRRVGLGYDQKLIKESVGLHNVGLRTDGADCGESLLECKGSVLQKVRNH